MSGAQRRPSLETGVSETRTAGSRGPEHHASVTPTSKPSFRLFTGNAHPVLAGRIAKHLDVTLGEGSVSRFPDGEIDVKIDSDVRGVDVFVVQPTCPPGNENLMELLILIDCLRRASADRITAVIPYFGYARKDRKDEGRVPISAKLVANLITTAGADRVVALDLHAAQIQGFFDIPVDHLYAKPVFSDYFRAQARLENIVIVAPDAGGIKMARAYAQEIGAGLAIVDKRRDSPDKVESTHVIGDVRGKNVILVDDMISTAGTLVAAAAILKDHGAERIFACATHGVFCGPAVERIESSVLEKVVVTDSIPLGAGRSTKIEVLSVSGLLAKAILRIHNSESVSVLFEKRLSGGHKS